MSKRELIRAVAEKAQVKVKDTEAVVDAFLDVLADTLLKEGRVALTGFGVFQVKETKERTGVKPGTTEKIKIPARKRVVFRASSELKKKVGQ